MKIDRLVNATALRTYATEKELAEAVSQLIAKALSEDLSPHSIDIVCSEDYETSGEYHIVLWAD